ncbi:MAG: hypothetical protein EOO38_00250 [Cytophagaceae bacterium]|nr:MAG: hypothetical protein EOO38_00250 [Cytophagaceae bacterium]
MSNEQFAPTPVVRLDEREARFIMYVLCSVHLPNNREEEAYWLREKFGAFLANPHRSTGGCS